MRRKTKLNKLLRSDWIPGSNIPTLSENRTSFLRLLKNKGFKEERLTKVGLYAIGTSTTLESNKSLRRNTVVWWSARNGSRRALKRF